MKHFISETMSNILIIDRVTMSSRWKDEGDEDEDENENEEEEEKANKRKT